MLLRVEPGRVYIRLSCTVCIFQMFLSFFLKNKTHLYQHFQFWLKEYDGFAKCSTVNTTKLRKIAEVTNILRRHNFLLAPYSYLVYEKPALIIASGDKPTRTATQKVALHLIITSFKLTTALSLWFPFFSLLAPPGSPFELI